MKLLFRCLIICMLALLATTAAWAGMDDTQTIIRITGKAEVRGRIRRKDTRLQFAHWAAAKEGDVLGPGCSLRTSTRSTVRMRLGDSSFRPHQGDNVSYITVQPHAVIHLHSYASRKKLVEIVQGRIIREVKML